MRIIESITKALRSASAHNPDVQLAPSCILWPDGDRQWENVVPRLQSDVPELFQLGTFAPDKRIGPAIWLRCVITRKLKDFSLPENLIPILYLPGVSRQDLRAVEACPEDLKPLAELQFRGVICSQVNAKDWTILAYLKSNQGGLGLDVAQDSESKHAMQLALYRVLDEEVGMLKGKHLDKDYFNTLLSGGDPIRDLLQWLDQGDGFKAARDENQWRGFVEICKSQLGFDPENDGPLKAAEMLANRKGPWNGVWGRFCEAPARYAKLPALIRKTPVPMDFFEDKSAWPQWNEQQEKSLRQDLLRIASLPPHQAREAIIEADAQHGARREQVWADIGESPLALALAHLTTLAEVTTQSLAAGSAKDMAAAYQTSGWAADASALQALGCIQQTEDQAAVNSVLRNVYLPWLDEAARHLQSDVDQNGYPGGFASNKSEDTPEPGLCYLFVDGLRYDLACRLRDLLAAEGLAVDSEVGWAALPSVTATAKPSVTPVKHLIQGQEVNADFEPSVAATGQSLKGGYHLKKLLKDNGWKILDRTELGSTQDLAWTEISDIDHEGHERGAGCAKQLDSVLKDIRDRIKQLIGFGWRAVQVVTDHGWLLMPGGLPKTELPSALSENTWGRCAAIKPGASCKETLFHWHWNPNLSFALAPGVSCYRNGVEYTHGGISLQECVVMKLCVSNSTATSQSSVTIGSVAWKGFRCKVTIFATAGDFSSLRLDIRTHAGNSSTSVATTDRPFKEDGTASVVVEDDSLIDHQAMIVVIDASGHLVAQQETIIGKE
jgi:hypothetical protein